MDSLQRQIQNLAEAGLLIQVTAAAVLWLLFLLIRRQGRRRYFTLWTWAWLLFAVAFAALTVRYRIVGGALVEYLQHEDQPLVRSFYLAYQVCKALAVGLLLAGALQVAGRTSERLTPRHYAAWGGALGGLAALTVLVTPMFEHALALQSLLVVPMYAAAGWVLLRVPAAERSLGRLLAGTMLLALAALWVVYGFSYSSVVWDAAAGRLFPARFRHLMDLSTLVDSVWMVLLAFGQVLILTEDLHGEADRFRTVLSERMAQAQKMEAVGRLVSGVAHELNNPLAAILAFSEELLAGARDPEERESLEVIRDQSRRARTIVRDLLAFVGRREERREPVDAHALLTRVAKGVGPELARQGAALDVALAPDLPALTADRAGLEQVITNLLANAAYAAGRGGRVLLSARRTSDGELQVSVTDSGPGIAPEVKSRLFEPFFTTKPAGQGTGLGLSVSLGIVEQHGGHIDVESVAGGGARFVVTVPGLPAGEAGLLPRPEEPQPVPRPRAERPGVEGGRRVLLVDDELPIRTVMRRGFEREGGAVEEAVDGAQALSMLPVAGAGGYHLVMCDLKMPGLSAIELVERLER
ncbi:MAG TPA: ATP-binding protein, partial [Gemmatimonadales bacterium]|nr:ATP-binding protein [Gemmatimonadales bacterium]